MATNPKRPAKKPPATPAKPVEPVKEEVVENPPPPAIEQDSVLIERRVTVADIKVEQDGDPANAVTLAFATAAEYIAVHDEPGTTVELEFVIGDRLYTATAEDNE